MYLCVIIFYYQQFSVLTTVVLEILITHIHYSEINKEGVKIITTLNWTKTSAIFP